MYVPWAYVYIGRHTSDQKDQGEMIMIPVSTHNLQSGCCLNGVSDVCVSVSLLALTYKTTMIQQTPMTGHGLPILRRHQDGRLYHFPVPFLNFLQPRLERK